MAEKSRSGRFFELLATAAAAGATIKSAAESCGCSHRQAYRISSTIEFKQRVSQIRTAALDAATGEITSAASEAVACIRELLGSTNEPTVRLNAAKSILTQLKPMFELSEIRARLEALENKT